MWKAAGVRFNPMGEPYQAIRKSGDAVRADGVNICTFASLLRLNKDHPDFLNVLLDHLEASLDHFEYELIQFVEGGPKPPDLTKLALYRVLASEVSLGEARMQEERVKWHQREGAAAAIPVGNDPSSDRHRSIGGKYAALAKDIPDELYEEYASVEDKYQKFVKEIYPQIAA